MEQVGNLPGVPLQKPLLSSSAEDRVKQAAALGPCRVTDWRVQSSAWAN